jgi:cytochrome c oxidase subunit 4
MADEERRKSGRRGGRRKTDLAEAVITSSADAGPVGRGVVAKATRGLPLEVDEHGETHRGHATVGFYWIIGGILAVITALEVAVFYIPAMQPVLTPVLLVLSAAKFALVVMFFMHLRFDSFVLTGLFGAGLVLATLLVLGLVILYHYLPSLGQ